MMLKSILLALPANASCQVNRIQLLRSLGRKNSHQCQLLTSNYSTSTDLLSDSEVEELKEDQPLRKKAKLHWIRKMVPSWQNTKELHKHLTDNIFYEDNHIVALTKPVGLPAHSIDDNCLQSYLEPLRESKNSEDMKRMFSPSKLYSGVVILAKTNRAREILTKYFTHCQTNNIFCHKYRAITVGIPQPSTSSDVIGVDLKDLNDGPYKVTVRAKEATLSQKKRDEKRTSKALIAVNMNTLKTNLESNVALVDLETRRVKWDALQVYLLHKLAPLLGDHMYSGRLQHVLNKPVFVDFFKHDHMNSIQKLPLSINKDLALGKPSEVKQLPLFIHCSQVEIPQINNRFGHIKSRRLILESPLPDYFAETICRLGLQ